MLQNKPSRTAVIDLSQCHRHSKTTITKPNNQLNPLGLAMRQHILRELQRALNDPSITSVVLTGGGPHFSAGADLTEFSDLGGIDDERRSGSSAAPNLLDVVAALEASPKPVIAAIAGVCLGGGCELALACHGRVALSLLSSRNNANNNASADDVKQLFQMGLPEVHVGVIPGAGGTQRLPRLIGLESALQLILTGQAVKHPLKAKAMGLVDDVVQVEIIDSNDNNNSAQEALLHKARQWAAFSEVALPLRRTGALPIRESPAQVHVTLHAASLNLARPSSKGGMFGWHAALEAIRAACTCKTLEEGQQVETQQFLQCLANPEGAARRHVFFATRQAAAPAAARNSAAVGGAAAAVTKPPRLLQHPLLQKSRQARAKTQVAVIGAGTMGAGIAIVLLRHGFTVWLVDVQEQALQKGLQIVKKSVLMKKQQQKKKQPDLTRLLRSTCNLSDLADCHLVVEAVVERLSVKQSIFRQLDAIVTHSDALLVSNTSTLSIDAMASALQTVVDSNNNNNNNNRQAHFAGWHFFSPAHVMKLVEIVTGTVTSDETVHILQMLTKQIGKIGVVVGNCDGFCGNRLLKPYSAESGMLLVERHINVGDISVQHQDEAITQFGMALGPFAMGDLAGNDVGYNIRVERGWARPLGKSSNNMQLPNRPDRYTELADVMIDPHGRLGQKSGKGWYDYDPNIGKGRTPLPSSFMDRLVAQYRKEHQQQQQMQQQQPPILASTTTGSKHEYIIQRVLYPLVNEGFKCLEEGIVARPSDIDVVYVYGYGWPAWRGGPMYWADHAVTLPTLLETLERFHRVFPTTEHYRPSKLLCECVRLGLTVNEYYRRGLQNKPTSRSKL